MSDFGGEFDRWLKEPRNNFYLISSGILSIYFLHFQKKI